jgi:hypothetical protein
MVKNQQSTSNQAPLVLSGKIADAAGMAVQGFGVRAYERRLRAERELGRGITDGDGQYRIEYQVPERARAGKPGVDLLVKVFRGKDPEPIIVSSVAFNAGETHQIDLTLPAPEVPRRSEYETLVATLEPALEGIGPADLSDEDLQFLAGDTGVSLERIALLRQSAKVATETEIPAEVFYALARAGMPIDDPARLSQHPLPALRRALESAIDDHVLPERLKDELDSLMDRLRARALDEVLRPDIRSDRPPVGALLATSRLSPAAKESLVAVALEQEGARADFWLRVAEAPELADTGQLEEARATLQLGVLTGFHLPLVETLQDMRADGRLTGLSDLARWDEEQWLDLVRATGTPDDIPDDIPDEAEETKAENYAASLFRQTELAFPTPAIAAQLDRSALPERKTLGAFFADHADFDLLADSVERSFGPELDASVRADLKRIQRVARVTPRFSQIETLIQSGLTSAEKIGAMSEGAFVARMSNSLGSEQEAGAVYRRAAQRKDLALNLRIKYGAEQDAYRFASVSNRPVLGAQYRRNRSAPSIGPRSSALRMSAPVPIAAPF